MWSPSACALPLPNRGHRNWNTQENFYTFFAVGERTWYTRLYNKTTTIVYISGQYIGDFLGVVIGVPVGVSCVPSCGVLLHALRFQDWLPCVFIGMPSRFQDWYICTIAGSPLSYGLGVATLRLRGMLALDGLLHGSAFPNTLLMSCAFMFLALVGQCARVVFCGAPGSGND